VRQKFPYDSVSAMRGELPVAESQSKWQETTVRVD
jgi:hypothetical protein